MTSPIEWLMDREILRQFPQRYARAVDQRDHDALTALFDPDGSVDGTFGQQAVADYLDTMGSRPTPVARACTCSPIRLIDLDAGADTARLDTYAVVYQVPRRPTRRCRTLGMRYVDDMVRREGGVVHPPPRRPDALDAVAARTPHQAARARAGGLAVEDGDLAADDRGPEPVGPSATAACRRAGRSRTTSGTAGPTRVGIEHVDVGDHALAQQAAVGEAPRHRRREREHAHRLFERELLRARAPSSRAGGCGSTSRRSG